MRKWNDDIVRSVTRGKATAKGKSATLAMRNARAEKYAPSASLTRSGHVRTIREVR